jgi:hypothetical protein
LTAANISAGTAGINISGNAATATSATSATTAGTATIGSGFTSLTSAGIRALTPATVGQVYYCSDCAVVPVCVSTGTAIASFALITGKTSVCQ